jgi:hypothetical protein
MKHFLLALLVTFSSASGAWATRPESADLPERNNLESFNLLASELSKAGVGLSLAWLDERTKTACEKFGEHTVAALFTYRDESKEIGICKQRSSYPRQVTLLHEVAHVLQWCNAGKPPGGESVPLGWDFKDYTEGAIKYIELNGRHYQADELVTEAEAQSFAEITSYRGAALTVRKFCNQ